MRPEQPTRYSSASIGLHWLMLVLLAAVYASIELRELFPNGTQPREAMKALHFTLGLSVFGLAWLRLLLRIVAPAPPIRPEPAVWQRLAAAVTHILLYALMIGLPLLGWGILSAEGKPIPFLIWELPPLFGPSDSRAEFLEELHEMGATVGYLVIGLHAIAALFHHYLVRDNMLRRMLPGNA